MTTTDKISVVQQQFKLLLDEMQKSLDILCDIGIGLKDSNNTIGEVDLGIAAWYCLSMLLIPASVTVGNTERIAQISREIDRLCDSISLPSVAELNDRVKGRLESLTVVTERKEHELNALVKKHAAIRQLMEKTSILGNDKGFQDSYSPC